MATKYRLPIKLIEYDTILKQTRVIEENKSFAQGRNIDAVRKAAKEFCEKKGRLVRSLSISENSVIVVVFDQSKKPPELGVLQQSRLKG